MGSSLARTALTFICRRWAASEWESEAAAVRKYLIVYAIAWAYFKHFVRFAGTFNGQHEENAEWNEVASGDKGEEDESTWGEAIKAHAK